MNKVNISDQELDQRIAQLPTDISPQRDLWVGVERAITQQEKKTKLTVSSTQTLHIAWAASFVVAILFTWGLFNPQQQHKQTPLNLAVEMEQSFEQHKKLILTSYNQVQQKTLSADMQKQFNELSSARAAINKALIKDPNNNDLLNLLRWTQQQELTLLQQIYSPQWQTI